MASRMALRELFRAGAAPRAARSYVTAASGQPPLVLHGIDGRYATALFTAAQKQDVVDKVEADLAAIKDLMDKDAKFRFFMETPIISREAKKAGVKAALGKGSYSKITANFFETLADNGRLDQTPKIVTAFSQLLLASRGQVQVTVTSAKELDSKTLGRIRDLLQKSNLLQANQKASVTSKVNPAILGGLIVEVGDKTIDLSVSSKISKLNRLLSEAI
ncbi:OSCP/delta subunit of ATPase [Hyaloraphidium curvatum]|nr:OSCP/delta subunit of ATPase [Hyaloraphidium curvatum]